MDRLIEKAETHQKGFKLITGEVDGASADTLKQMGYELLRRQPDAAVSVLGSSDPETGKVFLVATVTDDLVKTGLKAGQLVGSVAKIVGGGGGGQPTLATAGGRFPEKLTEALASVGSLV